MKISMLRFVLPCLLLLLCLAPASLVRAAEPNPIVVMETSMGRVIIMLYAKEAPITVANFVRYVDEGYYNGTIFHRIVKERKGVEVIQGGGFVFPMDPKYPTHPPIPLEASKGLLNKKGTIAMARGVDPDSATTQFFFNMVDNPNFDYLVVADRKEPDNLDKQKVNEGYCAFGKVRSGMDVLEKIINAETRKTSKNEGVPVEPIYIKRMYRPQ